MLDLLTPKMSLQVRHQAARVLGRHGLDEAAQQKLDKLLADPELRDDAALALLLGGSLDAARRAVDALPAAAAKNDFGDLYYRSFGYFADADLAGGDIYRWVENAQAVAGPPTNQKAFQKLLSRQFENLVYDSGPHSLDRVQIRYRLYQAAASGPGKSQPEAVATLELMRERGTLLALAAGKGKTAALAAKAADGLPDSGNAY